MAIVDDYADIGRRLNTLKGAGPVEVGIPTSVSLIDLYRAGWKEFEIDSREVEIVNQQLAAMRPHKREVRPVTLSFDECYFFKARRP